MVDVAVTGGPIAHDIQYYLDCAAECFDIPPDVYIWARTFHPNLTQLVDSFDEDPTLRGDDNNHGNWLSRCGDRLEKLYLEWQEWADPNAVAFCLAYGVTYSPTSEFVLNQICNTLVDDEQSVLTGIAYYDSARTYAKDGLVYYDGLKLFQRKRGFFESLRRIHLQWEQFEAKPDLRELRLVYPPRIEQNLDDVQILEIEDPNRGNYRPNRLARRKPKPLPKEKKKALRKSADLLNTLTGSNTTQLFLSGKEVTVTGQKYVFSLTKELRSSLTTSHGSATTSVYDKASGEFVCGLCVYTAGVTVFDHLASLVLHCKSGLEDQIIMDANITKKGRMDLLPAAKREQIELERRRWAPQEVEVINLADIESQLEIVENRVAVSLFGENNKARMARESKVRAANDLAKRKLIHRIKRKHPDFFRNPTVRFNEIRRLAHGPEIG